MRLLHLLLLVTIPSSASFVPVAPSWKLIGNNQRSESSSCLFENKKAQVQISSPAVPRDLSPTSILDYILTLLTSDISSIVLGSVGILLALSNRLSSIDYEATLVATNDAADMGAQSRIDLLAVFSAGAVLLNGVSKLDVTSALAESVVLDGKTLDSVEYVDEQLKVINESEGLQWALESIRQCSPAKTAIFLGHDGMKWRIIALDGIVPPVEELWRSIPDGVSTPILDRFLKDGQGNRESYLPTLQALPGRSEFTYLPQNTQEVLLLPIDTVGGNIYNKAALVLGSDTAKTFTPRDIAWCQVLATRMGTLWRKQQ